MPIVTYDYTMKNGVKVRIEKDGSVVFIKEQRVPASRLNALKPEQLAELLTLKARKEL